LATFGAKVIGKISVKLMTLYSGISCNTENWFAVRSGQKMFTRFIDTHLSDMFKNYFGGKRHGISPSLAAVN